MKNMKYTKSIRFKILLSFIILIFTITATVFSLSYYFTLRIMENNTIAYTQKLVGMLSDQVDSYISYMDNISDTIAADSDVKRFLSGSDNGQEVRERMNAVLSVRSDISSIILFSDDGRVVLDKENQTLNPYANYQETQWYQQAKAADSGYAITSSYVQNIIKDDYRWVISMAKTVRNKDGAPAGVLLIDLNYNVIRDLCVNITLGENGYVFILNESSMVYHPHQQLIYANIKQEATDVVSRDPRAAFTTRNDATGRYYTVETSQKSGWKVAGTYDLKEILTYRRMVNNTYIVLFLVFLAIGFFISQKLSSMLTKPMNQLIAGMRRAEQGAFDTKVNITTEDEIGRLASVFNTMLSHIDELVEKNKEELENKRKSELKALQAQINPHFLYNTLDSIVWMAEMEKSQDVVEMTLALSNLFRSSISDQNELVPLETELKNIESYLTIQKYRYADKLNFKIDIPGELYGCLVIKLMLQPLVENAIYHGIKEKNGPGMVIISGFDAGADFILNVEDDGTGMTKEQIRSLLDANSEPAAGSRHSSGIGVKNVDKRIKLYFGEEYGLTYSSEPGRGTRVMILLPKTGAKEGDA